MAIPRLDLPVDQPELPPIDQLIDRQAALVPAFERLIRDKTRDALSRPDHDGRWSVLEIVCHLLDWERVTHDRVHRILADDRPTLPEFDDTLWAVEHHYGNNDIATVLADLRDLRGALVAELATLPTEAWRRPALLEGAGPITLHWLVDRMSAHDDKHLAQARDILS